MSKQSLTRYMPTVAGYRERLATLQGAWDSLALLSHLTNDGTSLSTTRQAFESLAADLVAHLAAETHKKALVAAKARAQVAIDILVRNLFERTADIGFLAADSAIRRFAREVPLLRRRVAGGGAEGEAAARTLAAATRSLQRRLAEYVAKYSIYNNVVLIAPDGEVLLQLDGGSAPASTDDPLVNATLVSTSAYVETFRQSDIVPGARRALIYSQRVASDQQTLGVLCLCFRLEDECAGVFAQLHDVADWMVLTLLDATGEVIASSDGYQFPIGARLPKASEQGGDVIRFAGREYLSVTRSAQPYQGYAGPTWQGQVMAPIERAFESHAGNVALGCSAEILSDLRTSSATFSDELRAIPQKADSVQRDLNRSVWNGSVRLSLRASDNGTFAKALLWEISNMGRKTKEVFERSIEELHETVVSAILHDSAFMASLAVEILTRNLYERANDCRWWALDATLSGMLSGRQGCDAEAATRVLQRINELYTVYHGIVLFDAERRVVAVSRLDHERFVGEIVAESWVAPTLGLASSQDFTISPYQPSAFYDDRPTLIYGAGVRSADGRILGGIAIVFDTQPQLTAMLTDALPRDERGLRLEGSVAMFLDSDRRVMCSTDSSIDPQALGLDEILQAEDGGHARVVRLHDTYYALGTKQETGYREYRGTGTLGVVLIPLGAAPERASARRPQLQQRAAERQANMRGDALELATFSVGSSWYAVPTSHIVEATDVQTMQSLPNGSPYCAGYFLFNGEPVVVADLHKMLGNEPLERACTVIVMRPEEGRTPFGILVESLGDIPQVARERLLPVAAVPGQMTERLVEHAIQPQDPREPLVMVLSSVRLGTLLRGSTAEMDLSQRAG